MSWPGVIGRDAELGHAAALLTRLANGPAAVVGTEDESTSLDLPAQQDHLPRRRFKFVD
jgi:hypothetical protein